MSARSRMIRRVVLLLLLAAIGVGGLAGAYAYRKWQRNQRALEQRRTGVAAFKADRYADAIPDLIGYIRRYDDDIEVLDMLVKARLEVPAPNNGHLGHAIGILRRILDLDPERDDARRKLLELYSLTNMNTEAIALADGMLATNPDDTDSLHDKALALARLRRFAHALPPAQRCATLKPSDLEAQTLLFDVQFPVDRGADGLIAQAAKLREQQPDDPRWELLQAYAYRYANDRANMVTWLKAAAGRPAPDEKFTVMLVRLLDEAGLFAESVRILEKAAASGDDANVRKELVRRLWEQSRWDEVIERLGDLDPSAAETDVESLALKAIALYQLKRQDEANTLVSALAAREKDPLAVAWAAVLQAVHREQPETPAKVIEICKEGLKKDPGNAFFEFVLGNAYARMGERELAMGHWRRAAQRRPVWVMPRLRLAQAHLASGQRAEALGEAQAAVALAPKTVEAAVVWAQARGANLTGSQADSAETVLKLVDDILTAMPSEHRVIPLRISLLVQTGRRDDAIKAFEMVLAQKEPLSQATLLQLEQLSRALGLGLEQQCAKQLESLYGQTPEITLAQALQLANSDKPDEGLKLIEQRQQAIAPADALNWQSVRARYLDATRDPRARAEWTALADQYPQNSQVQRQALKSPAVQANKEVADRLIERLRGLSGDQGVAWRLERARWLLRHTTDTKVDLPKATAILEKIVADAPAKLEARLLLANGLERLGYTSRAITELESVVRQRPQASAISLELARLDQKVKNFDAARAQLERVLNDTTASAAMRARAAAMLADQGNDDLAIAALEKAASEATRDDPDRDVLLARLYWRRNEMDKVEALCPKIKAAPTEDGVRVLALYYASQGRADDAEKVLALLGDLDLPPGSREAVHADYYSQFGTRKQAVDAFLAATKAAPQDPITWYRLITAHILLGEGDQAVAAAADALKALPDDAAILLLQEHAEQVKSLAENQQLRPLLAALVRGPKNRNVAAQTIQIIAAAQAKGEPLITVSRQVRRVADRNPDFLPIQDLLTSIYLDAAKFDPLQGDEAIRVATRTMDTFPDAVEPAWLASVALARGNRWPEALKAAQERRRRAAAKPIQADLMIAEAKTRLGDTQEALRHLRPYVKRAAANPEQYPEILTSMTQTLLAAGKIDKAADTLIALLDKSPRWRQAWMQLAVLAINEPQTSIDWLKTVGTKIPADAASEQMELSRYWYALSLRSNNAEHRKTAQGILDNVVNDPRLAAEAWLAKGMIAVADNDSQLVERCYREALKVNPKLHAALNNLAMLEFEKGGDLTEALALAERAVAEDPSVANYYDSLAQVQAGMKDYDAAIAAIDKAIIRQSAQPQWKTRKEEILRKAGRHEEADQVKRQLDADFPGSAR